jgi:hypothetical protein
MSYSQEFLNSLIGMGSLCYDSKKIINVLDIEDEERFRADFDNKNSEIYRYYQKGKDKADYLIDVKLFELAKEGDTKAYKLFEARKLERQEKNLIK